MNLDVAIIGAGWMGETHARAVAACGDRLATVIDVDIQSAEILSDRFGGSAHTQLSAAKGCDAAIVTTPSSLHLHQCEKLVDMELSVLVEKPHRLPKQNPSLLRRIVKRVGKPFQVGMTSRYNEGLQAIARAVHKGELGDVLSYSDRYWVKLEPNILPDWYFQPSSAGGGVLLTNGVHILDRCRWILGSGLAVHVSQSARLFQDHNVEDFALIQGCVGDTIVQLSLLWTPAQPAPSELNIIGTRGAAHFGPEGWGISTSTSQRLGKAVSQDSQFEAQWRNFRGKVLGFVDFCSDDPTLETLEPTILNIERIYDREDK